MGVRFPPPAPKSHHKIYIIQYVSLALSPVVSPQFLHKGVLWQGLSIMTGIL